MPTVDIQLDEADETLLDEIWDNLADGVTPQDELPPDGASLPEPPQVEPSPYKEEKALTQPKLGCLMAMLSLEARKEITDWVIENIPDFHLGDGGRELTPHCTIKFGFVDSSPQTLQDIRAHLARHGPFQIRLSNLSLFEDNGEGTVLKVDVDSEQIIQLNQEFSQAFECRDDFEDDYKSHLTLAYLLPDVAESYVNFQPPFLGKTITIEEVEWSPADGDKVVIPLSFLGTFRKGLAARTKEICTPGHTVTRDHCTPISREGEGPQNTPKTEGPTQKQEVRQEGVDLDKQTVKLPPLSEHTQRLVNRVRSRIASTNTTEIRTFLAKHFRNVNFAINKVREWVNDSDVTINFSPQLMVRKRSKGLIPMHKLLADDDSPALKNLFETNNGGGTTDKKYRKQWEENLYGEDMAESSFSERPKYGAINIPGHTNGAASQYGESCFVLNKDNLKDRITIAPRNSSNAYFYELGDLDHPEMALYNKQLRELVKLGVRKFLTNYVECQIHGQLPINSDTIKEIRVSKNEEVEAKENIKKMATRLGIPVKEV